ncbi:MAG: CBS domain-containing protein [Kofleriaceae bacterium]
MKINELMNQPIAMCHVNDPLTEAANRMWNQDCGALAVINDEGRLAGMITDRDICMAAAMQGRPIGELLVNAAMSRHVYSARADQTLDDVELLMSEHQVRRIPVVDADSRPIGMVSVTDLALASARSDSRVERAESKLARTLAAICRPHGTPRIETEASAVGGALQRALHRVRDTGTASPKL